MHLYKKRFIINHNKKKNLKLKKFCDKKIKIISLNEKNILHRKILKNYLKILRIVDENFENFIKKKQRL